ncbi:MAG: aromatic amino acid lyase, partial [Bacilli bacterium]
SSANQEDHVSMGTIAARGALSILENAYKIIGMEILTACQALDFRPHKKLGKGTQIAYDAIRSKINFVKEDQIMYYLLNQIFDIIKDESFINQIEEQIGKL